MNYLVTFLNDPKLPKSLHRYRVTLWIILPPTSCHLSLVICHLAALHRQIDTFHQSDS